MWFLIATLLCFFITLQAQASVWHVVPGDRIQTAIDNAAAGDQIVISHGLYHENLHITKTLELSGEGRPTLSGDLHDDTIRVEAPQVVIENMIIRDSGDSLLHQNAGIYFMPGADAGIVRGCDLTYNLFGL